MHSSRYEFVNGRRVVAPPAGACATEARMLTPGRLRLTVPGAIVDISTEVSEFHAYAATSYTLSQRVTRGSHLHALRY